MAAVRWLGSRPLGRRSPDWSGSLLLSIVCPNILTQVTSPRRRWPPLPFDVRMSVQRLDADPENHEGWCRSWVVIEGGRMRIGLAGTGRIGAFHAATLAALDDVREVVVTDALPETAQRLADQHGYGFAADLDELLGRVDALVIATS